MPKTPDDPNLPSDVPPDRSKVLLAQYQAYLDIYKQHFDLFLKGVILYLAAMSVIAGLVFAKNTAPESRMLLAALIPAGSAVAFFGFREPLRWVITLEDVVKKIEKDLGIESFPFSGAKAVIKAGMAIASVVGVAGLGILASLK